MIESAEPSLVDTPAVESPALRVSTLGAETLASPPDDELVEMPPTAGTPSVEFLEQPPSREPDAVEYAEPWTPEPAIADPMPVHPPHQEPVSQTPPQPSRTVVMGLPSRRLPARESRRPAAKAQPGSSTPPTRITPRRPVGLLIAAVGLVAILGFAFLGGVALRRQQAGSESISAATVRQRQSDPVPQQTIAASPSPAAAGGIPESAALPTGTLRITTVPSGAQVEIDGTVVGVTSLTLTTVAPGRRSVKISRAGFKPESREVEVLAGEAVALDLTLASVPPPASSPRRAPSGPPLPPPPLPPPP